MMRLLSLMLLIASLILASGQYSRAKEITIVSQQAAAIAGTLATPVPLPCRIIDKLNEKDDQLSATPITVGTEDIDYTEERVSLSGGKISLVQKKRSEPAKQIALKVLHTDTCEVEIIVITKRGETLEAPVGWDIEPVVRSNGIRWNDWNTEYNIKTPAHAIVLKNKYPNIVDKKIAETVKDKKGRKVKVTRTERTVEPIIYAPYSRSVHTPDVVAKGREYVQLLVQKAIDDLRAKQVPSRAYPGKLVADVPVFAPAFFEHLPIIEHADMTEFTLEPQRTTERVLAIIGLNGTDESNVAFAYTGNSAGANGLLQFTDNGTSGTYRSVSQRYPKAKLNPDFTQGARDHVNAMEAAILLHDLNLQYLIKKYGSSIATDPRLEEYLAALYNASPKSVTKSLSASLIQQTGEWTDKLLRETKGYITKLRYLRDSNIFKVPTS
jgi:hypothetical protein